MIKNNTKLNKKETKIVYKYSKIYNFIFKYSLIILTILISLIVLNNNIKKYKKLDISNDFLVEKVKLIWEFNKITNQDIENNEVEIKILQWSLNISGNLFFSTNNLISYKNIIMPKNVFLYDNNPIKDKTYFESWDYEIWDLENFAKSVLFTNTSQIETKKRIPISLPIEESISKTFYLNCTNNIKIFNKTCNHYIDNFIKTFFIYDISKDYEWLKNIFDNIKNTNYKKDFCDWMKKYILYSNDTNQTLENIFISCWDSYFKDFHTLKLFLDIQNQIENWYINDIVHQNKELNNYKLISYQQILYNDIHKNTIDSIRFKTYISYLQNLLKKNDKIDQFYIDLTYRFNNNYIINILNRFKYKSSDNKKIEIENIISELNKLNNWDDLVWYNWLKTKILNKNLEEENVFDIDTEINFSAQDYINKSLQSIKSLSFFKTIKERLSWDKIKISWYFSIKTNEWYIPIYSSIILKNINKELVIESIKINEYQELNDTIQNLIKIEDYSISKVYQYIQNNINIFMSADKISTCKTIENTINKILESSKNISSLKILECNSENISIIKNEEIDESNKKIYYKISMDNFNIENIMISDIYIENEIKKSLPNINTNNITISNMISKIISYNIEKEEYIQEWSNNIIITIEDFEKYLNTIPNDIAEGNNKIVLEFSIQSNSFIGTYNPETKKLWPISFKYNEKNNEIEWIKINKSDLEIRSFELYLKEKNQNEINKFLIDPINFLKEKNPEVISKYENLKYK